MKQNRKYDWPTLLKAFEQASLTQAQFCEQNNINPTYFSLQRSKSLTKKEPAFHQVKMQPQEASSSGVTIMVGRCQIICPNSMSIQTFSTLVHSLA